MEKLKKEIPVKQKNPVKPQPIGRRVAEENLLNLRL